MVDTIKSSRDEDQRKRDEAHFHGIQQQLDDLRRQLKESLARQQWFEELYKQGESRIAQVQQAQDRLTQDIAQALHARQVDEGRTKALVSDLAQKIDAPEKQLREIRAQIQGLTESRKSDRDADVVSQRQIDDLQRQIRDLNSLISKTGEGSRQLRDLMEDLRGSLAEVRQETAHVAELQRLEEQRLRRQGVELQGLFENLRQQFTEISAKSQRVDDVRHQLGERIEAIEGQLAPLQKDEADLQSDFERIEKLSTEQYLAQQERIETIRTQLEAQFAEQRQVGDQRMDRFMARFAGIDEHLRAIDQQLSELPSRFAALEQRDDAIGFEADSMEEWLIQRQLTALEDVLEDARKRRSQRSSTISSGTPHKPKPEPAPGSVYNPTGLIKSVRDAKPPARSIPVDEDDFEV
jgi:chromosome segregation ATPase